jgi:hypothetical protein
MALVAVLYVVWAHIVYPHNDIIRGNLPDPDDYMYLTQVIDWLKGQGWYDNIQYRLDPPTGVPIHFSRLAQIPMALGILFFEKLGLKAHGSAMLVALIYPVLLLFGCLVVVKNVTRFFVPSNWAGASSYIALFSVGLLFEFMPGHVDHHGLIIILIMACVGCVLRMMDTPQDLKVGAYAAACGGFILALSMTIALECLPWTLLLSAVLGAWAIYHGKNATYSSAIFALTYLFVSIIGLATTKPPQQFFEQDILTYSIVYIALAGCITLPFIGVAAAARLSLVGRALIGLSLALSAGYVFLHYFPELLTGPYGAIDPQLIPLLLNNVQEAQPILHGADGAIHMRNLMSMGFIALPASLYFTWKAKKADKEKWLFLTLVLAAAFFMTIFYQYRFLGMETAAAIPPLTALLYHGWRWAGQNLQGRQKVFAEIGFLLLVGPLPAIIVPALFDSRSFNVGMILFPVDSGRTPCDMARLERVLRDPDQLGDKPHLIVSTMELGPELLFRTEHKVLAAPYHMDVQGNIDVARFLSTPYEQEAEHIARNRSVDLVVVCRAVSGIYVGPKGEEPSLVERLFTNRAPDWLERVPTNDIDNFVVYRVRPEGSESSKNIKHPS